MTASPTSPDSHLAEGASSLPKSVQQYFETANAGDYEQTSALFAEDGQLVPPFEQPIVGRDAIAHYLTAEAIGMDFTPLKYEAVGSEEGPEEDSEESASDLSTTSQPCSAKHSPAQHWLVRGKVKTPLFVVNVAWEFDLNEAQEISSVKVKLLAKLNELLRLRS
ncbi:nuclear transport factor 2 family protein [cf. Phormidesmis sp. LEGE 11477]|uniref:nuclear transport factor 2 family protein n=1 Tax=cf. Phormidesmis sp. LEGE 11477 TaxID=1828680 RepID=UPI00188017BE|nr:nuclear transport factor 2 family protein [cf. Phormidesmis sp. LEGE 11477]MBE9062169.1 nuclear transport factor 2 family protein [cf. Phormidesmis sp. LEGE 11477]